MFILLRSIGAAAVVVLYPFLAEGVEDFSLCKCDRAIFIFLSNSARKSKTEFIIFFAVQLHCVCARTGKHVFKHIQTGARENENTTECVLVRRAYAEWGLHVT